MVATRRNNPDTFAEPMTLTVGGQARTFTGLGAVVAFLRKLEHEVITLNTQHARAKFYLGQALIEAADKLGHGHINHLYNECGINARRAQLAIKFAKNLAGEDGDFDIERFRMWERKALDMRERGEIRCAVDRQGTPSVAGIERAMKTRTPAAGKNEHVCAFDDGAASAGHAPSTRGTAYRSPGDAIARLRPAARGRADSVRGAGGGQLAIDFDLIAAERKLADLVGRVHDEMGRGRVSRDAAGGVHEALQDLCASTESILQRAKG